MTAKHTDGPWQLRKANRPVDGAYDWAIAAEIDDGGPYCIAEAVGRAAEDVWLPAEANARFIVRACNSHDSLISALEAARPYVAAVHNQLETALGHDRTLVKPTLDQIDAALAQAKE